MYRTDSERDFKALMGQKWAIVILNILVFLAALAIFGVCIWIRFDLDFWEWVVEIDWYSSFKHIFDREQRSKVLKEALLLFLLFFLAWKH